MKISFLFLIIDIIHNSKLWINFFDNAKKNEWSIYVHQKKSIDIGWFNQYKLGKTVDTRWADISLVAAQNLLLETSLEDKSNDMFVIVSGTCLPIRTLEYISNNLDTNFSYFNMLPSSYSRYKAVKQYMEFNKFKKASQWCILNRRHARLLVNTKNEIVEMFKNVFAADEHAYITILNAKCQREIKNQMITMANWDDRRKNKGYIKLGPKYYILMDIFEYNEYRNKPSIFFIRKIEKNCLLCCNGYDSFPGNDIRVMNNVDINEKIHVSEAYQICRDNNYGGFVFYNNKFYFRSYSSDMLFREKQKFRDSVLVLALTLEDRIVHDLYI